MTTGTGARSYLLRGERAAIRVTAPPGGLMVTMDGEQGADLVQLVRPRAAIGVHYDDYPLFTSPLSEFVEEMDRRGLSDLVRQVHRGQTLDLTDLVRGGDQPATGAIEGAR